MNQKESMEFLLEYLNQEEGEYRMRNMDDTDVRSMLRSRMNIRMPKMPSEEFLQIQDAFLQQEAEEKGIVFWKEIPIVSEQFGISDPLADKISLWQGDITRLSTDAIVNAANSQMLGCFVPYHRCIDNAIHSAAGIMLREECHRYMQEKRRTDRYYEEPTGSAVVTKGYNLPSKYVIHTVGPIVYHGLSEALKEDLRSCYRSCLLAAAEYGIKSVAFCCISTGEFHFPNDMAAQIAVHTVLEVLNEQCDKFDRIIFNVFTDRDRAIYETIFKTGSASGILPGYSPQPSERRE